MTINPHIVQAVARERVADLHRGAAGQPAAAECRRANCASQPARPPQPIQKALHDLSPAGTEKR